MTTGEVARLARDAGVGQLVLTGFGPHVEDVAAHRDEVAATFEGVHVAEDGDRVPIPRPRKPGG
jgi:ribonuclease BN (tRNA processing enzyme)